tara:strand:- start:1030 stop:1164 length:135 start_codon:yes stop_codon:yes gene_type:complete
MMSNMEDVKKKDVVNQQTLKKLQKARLKWFRSKLNKKRDKDERN